MCKLNRTQGSKGNNFAAMAAQPARLSSPPGLAPPPGLAGFAAFSHGAPGVSFSRQPHAVIAAARAAADARAAAESKLAAYAAEASAVAASLPSAAAHDSKKNRVGQPANASGGRPAKAAAKGPGGKSARAPPLQCHPCYKKKLCMWFEDGLCRNGEACHFAHGAEELRAGLAAAASPASPASPDGSSTPTPSSPDDLKVSQVWDRATTADSLATSDSWASGGSGLGQSADAPMKIDLESSRQMEAASRAQLRNMVDANSAARHLRTMQDLSSWTTAESEPVRPPALNPAMMSGLPASDAGSGQQQQHQDMIRMFMMMQQQQRVQTPPPAPSPMLADLEQLKATVQLLNLRCQQIQQQMMAAPTGLRGYPQ
mmetsp:Transcript_74204/g.194614  ORF Transcript_74204/g.194614 Transcript_74204/m.194614 type:complete len:371 (-) Transcript_74204:991-2103(-)